MMSKLRQPIPRLLALAACAALAGCGLGRAEVEAMRYEKDPAKAAAGLEKIATALAEPKPQAPDVRCALFDVGLTLAARTGGGGAAGERVRSSVLAEINAPKLPAEPLVGLDEAAARQRLSAWAAASVAQYAPEQALPVLVPLLGEQRSCAGPGMPLQSAALCAALGARARIANDADLARNVRLGALRLAAVRAASATEGAWPGGLLDRQLDAVLRLTCNDQTLVDVIADAAQDEAVRVAAVRQAHALLASWVSAGAVPAPARTSVSRLCSAVRVLADGPEGPLRGAAHDLLVEQLPYALLAGVPEEPARLLEAVLLLPRLSALAQHRPVGDLRLGLGPAAAVIDPSITVPGFDPFAALQDLVEKTCRNLGGFQGDDRWMVMEILATWTPGALADAFAAAWEPGAKDVPTARDWLSAMAIVRRRSGTVDTIARISNVAANIVAAKPPAGDPEPLWNLLAVVADGVDRQQVRAFSAVVSGSHGLEEGKATTAARFLVAAMRRVAAAGAKPEEWPVGIAALRSLSAQPQFEPIRICAPLLLEHAPDELVAGLIERSAAVGLDHLEAVLALDAALRTPTIGSAARGQAMSFLGRVCGECSDDDVRHAAARTIIECCGKEPAEVALVVVAVGACPVFAPLVKNPPTAPAKTPAATPTKTP